MDYFFKALDAIKSVIGSSRMRSLYWRASMMVLAGILTTIVEQMAGWNIEPNTKVFIGLILGEVSKALNNRLSR